MVFVIVALAAHAEQGGWSSSVLSDLLKEPDAPVASVAGSVSTEGMVLRTYKLQNLRVGEAGRSQTHLTILRKLLPQGSEINPDLPANSLHILTSPSAHTATWDFLSAVDVPEVKQGGEQMPEEVKKALAQFAATSGDASKLLEQVRAMNSSMTGVNAQIAELKRAQAESFKFYGLIAGGLVVAGGLVFWLVSRRQAKAVHELAAAPSRELSTQVMSTALMPVTESIRSESTALLNQVAIRMEGWHREQQKAVAEALIAAERTQHQNNLLMQQQTESLKRMDASNLRIEESVAEIKAQNEKVAAMADELTRTVNELDRTRDELIELRSALARDKDATEKQKAQLATKERQLLSREADLAKQTATLAALQVILDGGSSPAPGEVAELYDQQAARLSQEPVIDDTVFTAPERTPVVPDGHEAAADDDVTPRFNGSDMKFVILPPDYPEN